MDFAGGDEFDPDVFVESESCRRGFRGYEAVEEYRRTTVLVDGASLQRFPVRLEIPLEGTFGTDDGKASLGWA